jgi:uncharacterized membrane protein YfcA
MLEILILIIAGLVAGVGSVLLGMSAGIILVPIFFYFFHLQHVPEIYIAPLAVGTGLACGWLAVMTSAWTHRREIEIDKRLLYILFINSFFAALFLHFAAPFLVGNIFTFLFAVLVLSLPLIKRIQKVGVMPKNTYRNNVLLTLGAGMVNGLGNVFGLGGGLFLVVFFRRFGYSMKTVLAHCMVAGSFNVFLFCAVYIVLGWHKPLPAYSLGYIYLPGMLLVGVPMIFSAKMATHWRNKITHAWLNRLFNLLVISVGLLMLVQTLNHILGK